MVIWGHSVSCRLILCRSGPFLVIPGYSRSFQVIPGHSGSFLVIPGQAKSSWVKLSHAESSWVKLSQAESSWVKLSQAESSWVKLSQAESSWVKLTCAWAPKCIWALCPLFLCFCSFLLFVDQVKPFRPDLTGFFTNLTWKINEILWNQDEQASLKFFTEI